MSTTTTTTISTEKISETPTLTLRSTDADAAKDKSNSPAADSTQQPYRYEALLPVFNSVRYPPLEPFQHVDPGFRALEHPNPRSFLDNATSLDELTPHLGTEIRGVNLVNLTNDERDQLALEVRFMHTSSFRSCTL